jgi:pimeloyl-ACP methyl ester carboxylesterase
MQSIDDEGITDEIIEGSLPALYGERYRTDEDAIAYHFDRVRSMDPDAVIEALRAIIERDPVTDRLSEIRVPTLVVVGEEDVSTPVDQAEKIANAVPEAELVRVPGAGHSTPLEAPDVVNEALAAFLARVG